jgi:hypothetical protein
LTKKGLRLRSVFLAVENNVGTTILKACRLAPR